MKIYLLFSLLLISGYPLLRAAEISGNPYSPQDEEIKAKEAIKEKDLPVVALVVWDEKAKEGSGFAEFQIYQTGEVTPGLKVHYRIGGTAQKLISTAIIEKQDRITDRDLMNT